MSLQFSRSIRSLRLDSFRVSKIGLILATIILALLLVWFFFAKVTIYESTDKIEFQADGNVVATFTSEAIRRVEVGQRAVVRINVGKDQKTLSFPALVVDVNSKKNIAELLVVYDNISSNFDYEQLTGRVEVEVEYVKPVELVLRATGNIVNDSQIPVSPQSPEDLEAR